MGFQWVAANATHYVETPNGTLVFSKCIERYSVIPLS